MSENASTIEVVVAEDSGLQAKMLRKNPGMVINEIKPFRGRKDENESLVKWEAEGLKIRLDRDGAQTVFPLQH